MRGKEFCEKIASHDRDWFSYFAQCIHSGMGGGGGGGGGGGLDVDNKRSETSDKTNR